MDLNNIIEQEFCLDPGIVYLNHAAVSPWPRRTAEAVQAFAEENCHSGATNYLNWLEKEQLLREQLRKLINAPGVDDIGLLKNTSEALSVVASGIKWQQGDNIVSSNQEFPSNRIPWQAQIKHGVTFHEVDISDPNTAEDKLINQCDSRTRLLTISSVQYGTGLRMNLEKLGAFCKDNEILFCVDAIQSLGIINMDVQRIHADFVMADAHKWLLGPEGIALFYCSETVREQLELHQFGWHMVEHAGNYDLDDWQPAKSAKRFECGSPNMTGVYALNASMSLIESIGVENISRMIMNNINYIIDNLNIINAIEIISPTKESQRAGIITFKIDGRNSKEIYTKLMKNRVICANRQGGIRLSPHFYTSTETIKKGLEILNTII